MQNVKRSAEQPFIAKGRFESLKTLCSPQTSHFIKKSLFYTFYVLSGRD